MKELTFFMNNYENCTEPEINKPLLHLSNPFQSFWMAGFECSDKINNIGKRVDLLRDTDHINLIEKDYHLLKLRNITTVREGIRWSVVEKVPYNYNFETVKIMMDAARKLGIQQIWDLCHFGFPDDLSPLHPQFVKRFIALCQAFANFFVENYDYEELIITPINEVSFLSWLGGCAAGTVPFCRNESENIKHKLAEAYIGGIKCLKEINPFFKILTTEPLVNIVSSEDASEIDIQEAETLHLNQFHIIEILIGKSNPELGGAPELIDYLGFNFYYNNQWVHKQPITLPWLNENNDPRWRSLTSLIEEVHLRYSYPIILAETSHPGEDRPLWIKYISSEICKIIKKEIPFWGVCIYPIIDRPDWDKEDTWHHSGLWDYFPENPEKGKRVLNIAYDDELSICQIIVANATNETIDST